MAAGIIRSRINHPGSWDFIPATLPATETVSTMYVTKKPQQFRSLNTSLNYNIAGIWEIRS